MKNDPPQTPDCSELDTPSKRLNFARSRLGLSMREISAPLGISPQGVNHWLKGRSPIPLMAAEMIEKAFGISREWLLEGKGKPIVKIVAAIQDKFIKPATETIDGSLIGSKDDEYIPIPLVSLHPHPVDPIHVEMNFDESNTMLFSARWLQERIGADPKHLILVKVKDECMSPTLNPNDIIMINRRPPEDHNSGGIWIFRYQDAIHIARLQQRGKYRHLGLYDNKNYQILEIDAMTLVIGRVVWVGKHL